MPELPVIQNLNRTVFKTTTSAEMHRPYQSSHLLQTAYGFREAAKRNKKKKEKNETGVRILEDKKLFSHFHAFDRKIRAQKNPHFA